MSDLDDDIRARIARDANLRLIDKRLEIDSVLEHDPVWRYIVFCLEEEKRFILEAFTKVSPEDSKTLSHLQARALAVEMFPSWIAKLRAEANSAEEDLLVSDGRLTIPTD